MEPVLARARSLTARTVHIKISPTPRNLNESRVVRQELERQFGEVSMFRSLKYHPIAPIPNAATAIFQSESAAKAALARARHRYGLVIEPAVPKTTFVGPPIAPLDFDAPEQSDNDCNSVSDAATGKSTKRDAQQPKREIKEFQLDIWPSDFMHERYVKSPGTNPLWGPFKPISPNSSLIGAALRESVPPSLAARGLMDWETDPVKRRVGSLALEELVDGESQTAAGAGGTGGGNYLHGRTGFQSRYRQKRRDALPRVMRGLLTLREEAQAAAAAAEAARAADAVRTDTSEPVTTTATKDIP